MASEIKAWRVPGDDFFFPLIGTIGTLYLCLSTTPVVSIFGCSTQVAPNS
jgi:hypothetical protein